MLSTCCAHLQWTVFNWICSRDNQFFAYGKSGNDLWICFHSDCKDAWVVYVSCDRELEFKCQHIKQVTDIICVLGTYNHTAAKVFLRCINKSHAAQYISPTWLWGRLLSLTTRTLFMDLKVLPIPWGFAILKAKYKESGCCFSLMQLQRFCFEGKTRKVTCYVYPSSCTLLFKGMYNHSDSHPIFSTTFTKSTTAISTPAQDTCMAGQASTGPLHQLKLQAHLNKNLARALLHQLKLPLCPDTQH